MNELPVILCYFAQSQDEEHLAMLEQEENAIQLAWEPLVTANRVQYVARGSGLSTPEQMGRDIETYGNRIVLFHFSGHAGHDTLLLSNGAGGPDGIAGLLQAYAVNLKIAVLNGCSTQTQIGTFFGRGIPVVVATSCAVKDKHAVLFGSRLHQSLAGGKPILTAYRDAVLAVKSVQELGKLLPATVAETSTVFRGGSLDIEDSLAPVWGLFIKETGNGSVIIGDVRWLPAPTVVAKRPKINPEKAYIFERDQAPYSDTFYEYFSALSLERPRIQHYLLVGARQESPKGLIRKFAYEKILELRNKESYYYSFTDFPAGKEVVELSASDVSVELILRKLLVLVMKDPSQQDNIRTAEALRTQFFEQPCLVAREYALIAFRGPSKNLTAPTTQAILNTIMFLNETSMPLPGRVRYLFFWAIEQERSFWDTFSSTPLKKLISRFDPLSQGPLRPRLWVINKDYKFLKTPNNDDIKHWMINHYRKFTTYKPTDDLMKSLYQQSDVETLELDLLDLIEKANMQPT